MRARELERIHAIYREAKKDPSSIETKVRELSHYQQKTAVALIIQWSNLDRHKDVLREAIKYAAQISEYKT
jgi:hypothetical protein